MSDSSNYEYGYHDSNCDPHHACLIYPLLKLLSSKASPNPEKLRVLDLGCGNGSLSNLIAKQGYQVTGFKGASTVDLLQKPRLGYYQG